MLRYPLGDKGHNVDGIGRRLIQATQDQAMSHREAADYIGVSQATFSRWASGENIPASRYWTKIARFLKCPRREVADLIVPAQEVRGSRGAAGANSRLDELEREFAEVKATVERVERLVNQLLDGPKRPRKRSS